MSSDPILEIKGVNVRFGGLVALHDVDVTIQPGTIMGLIGPNGAGKTTLFNVISRIYDPDSGSVHAGGIDLLKRRPWDLVRLGIARTFQNVLLFPRLTVTENLLVAQCSRHLPGLFSTALRLSSFRRSEEESRRQAERILDLLEITRYRDYAVSDLPFGIQKRVELARSLVSQPRWLLLDEPAAGLNPAETQELEHLIRQLKAEFNLTILLVEHDMALVMSLCERIAVLHFGRKLAEGKPDEIQANLAVQEAYLGTETDAAS